MAQSLPSDLDLASPVETHTAQHDGIITVGSQQKTVQNGAALTSAEALALHQVLTQGLQSVEIGAARTAVGGQFSIDAAFAGVNQLNIPVGVSAVYQVNSLAALSLSGNLTNSGMLYAAGANSANTAFISALNITNNAGAVISRPGSRDV